MKIASTVKINVPTMASIFLKPNFIINNKIKTSSTVMIAPTSNGIPNNRSSAMALPITSAISVAIIASSAMIQNINAKVLF